MSKKKSAEDEKVGKLNQERRVNLEEMGLKNTGKFYGLGKEDKVERGRSAMAAFPNHISRMARCWRIKQETTGTM